MSTFNIRYGGQIESIPEGFNFNANYGTDKLHIKVNSTSTMKFGLTTNTNAQEYCHFSVRIGGQTAYIGRVYSTSYSGQVYIHDSSLPPYTPSSGYSTTSSKSTYSNSIVTSSSTNALGWVGVYSSSESVSTKITGQQTQSYTRNAGSGNSTAAANPTIRTLTNNTGSWVTTRTASAKVASLTWYSFSVIANKDEYRSETYTTSIAWAALGAKKTITQKRTRHLKISQKIGYLSVRGSNYNDVRYWYTDYSKTSSASIGWDDWTTWTASTTRRISATTTSNITSNSTAGNHVTVKQSTDNYIYPNSIVTSDRKYIEVTRSKIDTYTYSITSNGSVYSTSKTSYKTRQSRGAFNTWGFTTAAQAIQTLYNYSTRWSYWWTSCSKYTNTTYFTGTTFYSTITRRTETNSYTCHNMNI